MIQKILSIALLVFSVIAADAQDIAIGEWKAHLPFRKGVSVTQSENEVYIAYESQIAIIDKNEISIDRLNKVNGLSDVNIRVIRYNRAKNILLIAYENGNIDLVNANGIVNINYIKKNLTFNDKAINHISFNGDYAYLACNFGVVQINVVRNEIKSTFAFSNPKKVNATAALGDKIYAFTNQGIFEGDTTLNLLDFSKWRKHDATDGLWQNSRSQSAMIYHEVLYADVDDTLMRYENSVWQPFEVQEWNGGGFDTLSQFYNPNYEIVNIEPSYYENSIAVSWRGKDGAARMTSIDENGNYYIAYNPSFFANLNQLIIDQNNNWWFVDEYLGGSYLHSGSYTNISPNAPFNKGVQGLAVSDSKVWVAGGTIENWTAIGDYSGTYLLEEGFWKRYSGENYTELNTVPDHIRVVTHPTNGKAYLGTFGNGIVEIDGEKITVFKEGTSLQRDIEDTSKYKISGLAFDEAGNLWISNYGATRAISVLKTNGTWESFNVPSQFIRLTDIVVDKNGYKWFASTSSGNGKGILVFDEGDLNKTGDERYTILTSDNSELPNNDVISLAVDLDGEIWVGTTRGTMLFECTNDIFNGTCAGRRVVASADDFGDHLLSEQTINSIAVDGANRKWFGTTAGIFVQSADGEEDILRLNVNNSPLYSNNITALAIDHKTGEIYIGTDRGLLSYRSNATEGTETHNETNILAYPNPVRPDYDGPIAIKGLVENANVKITDINGVLIYETEAYGGQAIWDGRDYNGRKAASGVYLVFSSRKDGLDAIVTKILFLN